MDIQTQMEQMGRDARAAALLLARMPAEQKTRALHAAADALRAQTNAVLAANAKDLEAGAALPPAMRDRLKLDAKRIAGIAEGIDQVADLPDPVGRVLEAWDVKSNGLHIEKTSVPLGVIGMIYEARPNVTADATALAIKSGNAIILRGGSDSFHSSRAIMAALHAGLAKEGLPLTASQLVPTTDREAVSAMLAMHGLIDVIIPRGGKSLTERVQREARVPTLLHLDAIVHLYIHRHAELEKTRSIAMNAKLRRTGICGAVETILVDRAVLKTIAPAIVTDLLAADCEVRGDADIQAIDPRVIAATDEDWATEYLAPIVSIKVVDGLEDAIAHINRYSSHHTDAIITEDEAAAEIFTREVDSAIVIVNASTQFADGGEFGFGGEIGIATGRLHARGPVGAAQLTTYKYIVTTAKPGGAIRAG